MRTRIMPHYRISGLSPGRIALGYALIATLWIAFSDTVVTSLNLPLAVMTIKGAAFVFVTAALLYFTIRRLVQFVQRTSQERDETARLYRTVVEASNEGICLLDESGRISSLNGCLAAMMGRPAEELQGQRLQDFTEEPDVLAQPGAQPSNTHECRLRTDSNHTRWVLISRHPVLNDAGEVVQWVGTVIDITERKRAEEAVRRSNRELRAISNCNQVLLRATDEQSLLQEICRIVCQQAGYRVAWVGYAEHDEAKSIRHVASTGVEEGVLATLGLTWADTEFGRGPCGTAIRTGKTSYMEDCVTDPRGTPWKEFALRHGFHSVIALPLKDEQANTFGCLIIYSAQPNAFTSDEIRLLEELAGDLAFGIVTLRSRAAREKAEQEVALLSYALDKGHEAAFLMDEAHLFYVNEEACRQLGYTRAELLGMNVADIDPAFPVERWPDHWRELKAQGSLTFESRHRTRDGRMFPVEINANYFEFGGRAYNLALVRDITERKQAEQALQNSEANLNRAQEVAHIGSWHLDIARNQLTWSDEVYRIFDTLPGTGLTYETFLGRVYPEDREGVELAWAAALQGAPYDIEHRILVGDELKWVREKAVVEFDPPGKAVRGIGTVQEITERKRAEDEVRQSAAQWQATFDAVQDLVVLLDKDFRILRANHAAAEFLGLPLDKIVGAHCYDLIHGTPAAPAQCPLAKMRQSRRHEEEEVLARPGGPWLSVSVDPLFDASGELVQVVHVARDITERKRVEDELRRSEAYLAEGQRLTRMGSWAWNPATLQTLYWSEEMFRIFALNSQDGVPTAETFWQRIHPEDLDRTREVLLKAAAGNGAYEHDHRIVLPDGTIKHIHAVGHPVLDQDGQVAEYVGTAVDVTERKKSEEESHRAFEEIQRLKTQLEQQNEYLREEVVEAKAFGDLVGQSAALGQVVSQIDMVAPTDASVIILGETGTGKELVAHEIHRRSGRKDEPLVRVNCASIPKDLYESEFFGHVKGAFTGAVKDRAGRFETAEGGTLFLDEIAEVPLDLQSKLLRVLQEKQYERVGEDRTRRADVRIIAATNRDLKKEVEAGRFREDLYYRLNVFPIQVAPLRERTEDIPLLAQHFVQRSVNELRCHKPRLTRAGIIRLQSYDWPGNVRELQNVIERAVILARGGTLEFDLPVRDAPPVTRPEAEPSDDAAPEFLTESQLRQRERGNLLAVLERADWKIRGAGGAAELLGVKATTLLSRMKAMGLKRPE